MLHIVSTAPTLVFVGMHLADTLVIEFCLLFYCAVLFLLRRLLALKPIKISVTCWISVL